MGETNVSSKTPIAERGYVHPDVLVSTEWVAQHLNDANVCILESDEDLLLYDVGHIPGALKLDWVADLNHPIQRDYVGGERLQEVLRARGINQDTTIVLYGDKNNWWATYSLWVLRLFGIENLRIMDGGRDLWIAEGRELNQDRPTVTPGNIVVGQRDESAIRAFQHQVLEHVEQSGTLVDVRSPQEFTGERMHMPDYPNEGALRGGHIPGARSIPWGRAIDPATHTFLPADALKAIYQTEQNVQPSKEVVVYCRIGERSSHTWFVLTYLLGYPTVRNYDGSWTEWGNTVRVPIEK